MDHHLIGVVERFVCFNEPQSYVIWNRVILAMARSTFASCMCKMARKKQSWELGLQSLHSLNMQTESGWSPELNPLCFSLENLGWFLSVFGTG
jgi:hypothetical protein